MRRILPLLALPAALLGTAATAQLGLPPVGGALGDPLETVRAVVDPLADAAAPVARSATALARARTERLARLVRRNPEAIELDRAGHPARRGELLLLSPSPDIGATVQAAGFAVIGTERLDTLELDVVRLRVPAGLSLAKAQILLEQLAPGSQVSADTLYSGAGGMQGKSAARPASRPAISTPVGMIDGAPAAAGKASVVRAFASGGPKASNHGTAVASLLTGNGVNRLLAADVYGTDPAGGNALAIGKAIDWLAASGAKVVTISLVGPDNPLLARAIAAGQRRGLTFVAAVGNDGPAAPPAYPASYPGVLAVTGVDGRNRALFEAGRALHLDYAAPGADLGAADASGRIRKVRGTSFAAPLVAVRAAAALDARQNVIRQLDAEAVDLGKRGADPAYGRGLICATCR